MRRAMLGFLFVLLFVLLAAGLATAQGELLQNPSLDEGASGAYTTRRGGEFPIYLPNGWNVWLAGQSGDYYNRGDRTTINPHPGPGPSPQNGNRAMNVDCGFVTCTVAVYQQVTVEEGANVTGIAWTQVKACNIAPDADNCGSAVESGSQTRIGIDPNGGTNPNDSDIVWSNWSQPHDQWLQISVSATTTGTTATFFLYSTQANTAQLNRSYWDGTSLRGGGEGGFSGSGESAATPVPTAPPEVPFVVPQAARDDGSLTHTVTSGDTIDSIAVAYGSSRADILALNPTITDPRIISLGQKIVIRESEAAVEAEATAEAAQADDTNDGPEVPAEGVNLEAEVTEEPDGSSATSASSNATSDESTPESSDETMTAPEGSPATLTPAPVVSAALPASDPGALAATVCVLLFDDANQNRLQEPGETLLPGGTIQIASGDDLLGNVESALAPQCFDDLASGNYVVSASAPTGFGLTSPDQFRLRALAGSRLEVAFGAAAGVVAAQPPPADTTSNVSQVTAQAADSGAISSLEDLFDISGLIVFGLAGVVFVAGLGLTLFLRRR